MKEKTVTPRLYKDIYSPIVWRIRRARPGLLLVVDIELLIGEEQVFESEMPEKQMPKEWSPASEPNEGGRKTFWEMSYDGAKLFVRADCKNSPHLKPQIESWLAEHYGSRCTLVESFTLDSFPPNVRSAVYVMGMPPPALPAVAAENPCLTTENTLVKVTSREAAELAADYGFTSFTRWSGLLFALPPESPPPPTTNRQFLSAS